MPRSGPGRVTAWPSSSTRPVLGCDRPATMRNRVDLPQPDGPRMVMKSLSATSSSTGSRARTGGPPWTPGKTRDTPWMRSLLMSLRRVPGEEALVERLEQEVRNQTDQADDEDAEDHLPRVEQALRVHDHVADAAGRTDQLGDDDVGP